MEHLRYFGGVTKLREAHALYRELAKRLHPDNKSTGNAEWFMEMKEEYQLVTERMRKRQPVSSNAEPAASDPMSSKVPTTEVSANSGRNSGEMEAAIDNLAVATVRVLATWLKSFMM